MWNLTYGGKEKNTPNRCDAAEEETIRMTIVVLQYHSSR